MFSIDTESGFANAVLITGAYGLGESVVQGTVNPDEYYVFKPTLSKGFRPILQKKLGTKEFKLVYEEGGTRQTRSVPVAGDDRERFVLADGDILTLARWAVLVEDHYSRLRGAPTPMDIERAKDGRTGELFLVQARPETVHARRNAVVLERFRLERRGEVVAKGRSVGEKIGQGAARVIRSPADLEQLQPGDVLVTEMGLENVTLMVPFCRTAEEGRRVIAEMAAHGLVQRERGLEIYVMCEIPSNVTLAAEFAQVFDGFSIGSNDLTQLILGVDRDSELVAHLFDERNDAVKQTIAQVIRAAHAAGRKIGICGQAPSDYPDFAQFLVAQGIDSISLNPDSVLKTMVAIVEAEKAIESAAGNAVPAGTSRQ